MSRKIHGRVRQRSGDVAVPERSNRFIRIEEVEAMTGWDRTSIRRAMMKGAFPSARMLSSRTMRWVHCEVADWVAANGRQIAPMPPPDPKLPKPAMFGPPRPNPFALLNEEQILAQAVPYGAPGIYFLIKEERIVYIGQSVNVHARVAHHRYSKAFDRWHWIPVPKRRLNVMEQRYIQFFRPPLNMVYYGASPVERSGASGPEFSQHRAQNRVLSGSGERI
ncbi:transcriptional regulator, AlpA family [Roseomonas rosea]|uniref:Transcriptional regulator, AlpA family n=1 Tax=Muricoccus roseus TaxID=198092 RepID=A0A1M6SFS4_9PROT|nr:AlpA family phage regulatory protein [Roseomonas rosea]SHK43559.1 transcriptional regulator, AlpA family [Roseomonas rosea]